MKYGTVPKEFLCKKGELFKDKGFSFKKGDCLRTKDCWYRPKRVFVQKGRAV